MTSFSKRSDKDRESKKQTETERKKERERDQEREREKEKGEPCKQQQRPDRNSYPALRKWEASRQLPDRWNAKSRVDRSSTRILAFPWRRGCAESKQGWKPA